MRHQLTRTTSLCTEDASDDHGVGVLVLREEVVAVISRALISGRLIIRVSPKSHNVAIVQYVRFHARRPPLGHQDNLSLEIYQSGLAWRGDRRPRL